MSANERAITLGHPSYVWREGQERRLCLIEAALPLAGAAVLDAGCGLGLYVEHIRARGARTTGIDIDPHKQFETPGCLVGSVEAIPFLEGSFDGVLSHEVIEHVPDDRLALAEAIRVLKPGGRLVVFCPNRFYPFETHGFYWRGDYHFGNIPLVNYLPRPWRDRLCPHVRAYTRRDLLNLFEGMPGRIVMHRRIFAGYDNIVERRPFLGKALRSLTYALEKTPFAVFGLSHVVVFEKDPQVSRAREEQ